MYMNCFFRCVEDVKKSMAGFLQYVGTLKGLASIRDALWELLNPVKNRFLLLKWLVIYRLCHYRGLPFADYLCTIRHSFFHP